MTATTDQSTEAMLCRTCGWVYEESEGAPEVGVAPGTAWAELPENFCCPECAVRKKDFVPAEF